MSKAPQIDALDGIGRDDRQAGKKVRRWEYYVVLSVAAFAALMAGAAIWAGFDKVWAQAQKLPWSLVALMLAASCLNYGIRCVRWRLFGQALGVRVPWALDALYYFAGFALSATPGKAGEALRLWFLERRHGYAYEKVAPLFLGDRLSDMLAIALLGIVGVGAMGGYLEITLIAAALVLGAVVAFMRPKIMMRLTVVLWGLVGRRKSRLFARLRAALRDTARLLATRGFGIGLVLALVGWGAEAWSLHLLLVGLDAHVSLLQAVFVFAFGMIAGAASMLPGGLGGAEAAMLAALTALNVPFDAAVAATAIIRLTTLWFATGLGFIALPIALRLARRTADGPHRAAEAKA